MELVRIEPKELSFDEVEFRYAQANTFNKMPLSFLHTFTSQFKKMLYTAIHFIKIRSNHEEDNDRIICSKFNDLINSCSRSWL